MSYIFQADLWCDECGAAICADLARKGLAPANPDDYNTFDSEDFPKEDLADVYEHDSPNHCAGGSGCLKRIDLCAYGLDLEDELVGAESRFIGALITQVLSEEGAAYVREILSTEPKTPYQRALHALWGEAFEEYL